MTDKQDNLTAQTNVDAETVVSVYNDTIRVDIVNIGEGLSGDYDPDDPEDINLLRFDVYIKNPKENTDWYEIEDASYCTLLEATQPIEEIIEAAKLIHSRYSEVIPTYEDYLNGPSLKRLGEELSWIGSTPDIENGLFYGRPEPKDSVELIRRRML